MFPILKKVYGIAVDISYIPIRAWCEIGIILIICALPSDFPEF